MSFVQVKFKTVYGEPDAVMGGIAVYKYDHLIGVICGCCGHYHPAKEVFIVKEYEEWLNLGNAIIEINDAAEDWDDEFEDE